MRRTEFRATIPPIMSALRTGGDGMRVTFDVPEIYIGEAAKLLAMRGKVLSIIIQVVESEEDERHE